MPDRLEDALENSEPSRHNLICHTCGHVVKAATATGASMAMRLHRKFKCTKTSEEEDMSEPPGPDEEGPAEQYDEEMAQEVRDFLESEQFAELEDDMIIDQAGRGEDDRSLQHDMGMDDGEWELLDHLQDIHDQPRDEPIPELVSTEEAMKVIAEANKKRDEEAAAGRRAQSQGEDKVTISDDAQRIASIGNDQTAAGALNEAKSDLEKAQQSLGLVGEALGAAVQKIQSAAETVAEQSAQAVSLLGGEEGEAIAAQGQTVGEQCNNSNQHIGQADLGAVEASLQQTNLDGVMQQIQGLYKAIKEAAARHQK